jgi:hypothetical protein
MPVKFLFKADRGAYQPKTPPGFDVDELLENFSKEFANKVQNLDLTDQELFLAVDAFMPSDKREEYGVMVTKFTLEVRQNKAHDLFGKVDREFKDLIKERRKYMGYEFTEGPNFEGYRNENEILKRRFTQKFRYIGEENTKYMFNFITNLIFTPDNANFMDGFEFNLTTPKHGELFRSQINRNPKSKLDLDLIKNWYQHDLVADIIASECRDKEVLFTILVKDNKTRQGLRVKRNGGYEKYLVNTPADVKEAFKYGILSFTPAINKKDEMFPDNFPIEIDPGPMVPVVLGEQKAWEVQLYVMQQIYELCGEFNIHPFSKFSGGKSVHGKVKVDMRRLLPEFKKIVKAIAEKEGTLKFAELEKLKVMTIFEMAKTIYEAMAMEVTYSRMGIETLFSSWKKREYPGIFDILELNDFENLGVPIRKPKYTRTRNYEIDEETFPEIHPKSGDMVELYKLNSIYPSSIAIRLFSYLIDPSPIKKDGKFKATLTMNPSKGRVAIPLRVHSADRIHDGYEYQVHVFDKDVWDLSKVKEESHPDNAVKHLQEYSDMYLNWPETDVNCFRELIKYLSGYIIYALQWDNRRADLLGTIKGKSVKTTLPWKVLRPRYKPKTPEVAYVPDPKAQKMMNSWDVPYNPEKIVKVPIEEIVNEEAVGDLFRCFDEASNYLRGMDLTSPEHKDHINLVKNIEKINTEQYESLEDLCEGIMQAYDYLESVCELKWPDTEFDNKIKSLEKEIMDLGKKIGYIKVKR